MEKTEEESITPLYPLGSSPERNTPDLRSTDPDQIRPEGQGDHGNRSSVRVLGYLTVQVSPVSFCLKID